MSSFNPIQPSPSNIPVITSSSNPSTNTDFILPLSATQYTAKLPPDITRILYIKSLPFNITTNELYNLFGRYGPIHQIRLGNNNQTRGKAFVIYSDIYDAKQAAEALNGFNLQNRYLVVDYFNAKSKPIKKVKEENKDNKNNKVTANDLAKKPEKSMKRKLGAVGFDSTPTVINANTVKAEQKQ